MHRNHVFAHMAIVIIGGLLLAVSAYFILEIQTGNQQREIVLKQEIAHNLATKWNDCTSARRWVADYKCSK